MNFFRRKRERSLCFHEWRICDFGVDYEYNGFSEDAVDYYEIGCSKCGTIRKIDEYEFSRMCSTGMIARDSE
ncbi:hypothetical protein P4284_22970 [Bacillus swezeyi]|uniref:hypothetical protein n=1 Tax=Bacillus swezeyi TaxID=1925020 RepID=UPI002E1EE1B8|nr:hypothetical protein [Bacillus swezeyi]